MRETSHFYIFNLFISDCGIKLIIRDYGIPNYKHNALTTEQCFSKGKISQPF